MKQDIFVGNILFKYICNKVHCLLDVSHNEEGKASYILRIKTIADEYIEYAYYAQKGLCRISDKSEVIGRIATLNSDSVNDVIDFINNYGFFFESPCNQYGSYDFISISQAINRFQKVVLLLNEIISKKSDTRILFRMMNLIYITNPIIIPTIGNNQYTSCIHEFTQYLRGVYKFDYERLLFTDTLQLAYPSNGMDGITYIPSEEDLKYYKIYNTVYDNNQKIYKEVFHDCYDDYYNYVNSFRMDEEDIDLEKEQRLKMTCKIREFLTNAFVFTDPNNLNLKLLVDALYSVFTSSNTDTYVDFVNAIITNPYSIDCGLKLTEYKLNIDKPLKNAISKVAKNVLKQELDYNLSRVSPVYNSDTMTPSWSLPNLYTALWFSIFYLRTDYEIYRQCANPNCKRDREFIVSATNRRKIYCCDACRNAAAQRRHNHKDPSTNGESI